MQALVDGYMRPLFYFALKKTSDRYEAEELTQEILLEAYDNPSTAGELSLALGIAMPYMEDEIRLLLEAELLRCENGRYKTNMNILSKKAQDALNDIGILAAGNTAFGFQRDHQG